MRDLRVALAQVGCCVGDLSANLELHASYVERAAAAAADVVCFPECSLTGYPKYDDDVGEYAQPLDGPLAKDIVAMSGRSGLTVLAGMIEQADGRLLNTQLVAQNGQLLGAYRKVHISDAEGALFSAGDDLPVWDHAGTSYGVQICYDNHFPEAARAMSLQGATVLFCPYASPGPCTAQGYEAKQQRWLRYLTARAFDNSLFVCAVNQVGSSGYEVDTSGLSSVPRETHMGLREFPGGSLVLNPWGEVIARARPEVEDLLVVDLRAETLAEKRNDELQDFQRFRRPDLYRDLTR